MVINVGAIKSRDWHLVKRDIEGVVEATRGRAAVKVILETCLLTDEEEGQGLHCQQAGRRCLCQDLHRLLQGRRHRGGRAAYEGHRWS